jgi:hypothetical protein
MKQYESSHMAAAHQDGCRGEGESGKTVCRTPMKMLIQNTGIYDKPVNQ